MKVKAISMAIAFLFIISGLMISSSGPITDVSGLPTGMYTVTTGYGLNEDFSGTLDWHAEKGNPLCTVAITNGELNLSSYGIQTQTAWHEVNISKQDYTISFNYRLDDNIGTDPWIGNLFGVLILKAKSWPVYETPVYESLPVRIFQALNLSLYIEHDDGTRTYVPSLQVTYSPKLDYDVNYQITLRVWGWNDTSRLSVFNKSSSTYLFQSNELPTYRTHADWFTYGPIPDRIYVGDGAGFGEGTWFHAYWDNFTITYSQASHPGMYMSQPAIETAIDDYADQILDIEYAPDTYRLGYNMASATWDTDPAYRLHDDDIANARDDVAGEVIETLVRLYEYTGRTIYRTQAIEMYNVLLNHVQPDGGFVFGNISVDYVDTGAKVIMSVLALYRATGDASYLSDAQTYIVNMLGYQNSTGHVYGREDRYLGPGIYRFEEQSVPASYFVVALLKAYSVIGTASYLTQAELTLEWMIEHQGDSGRTVHPPWGSVILASPDWSDVISTGASLWALSEGYKVTGDPNYLHHAELSAKYLVNAEFTKGSESFGLWMGAPQDRYNQSDLTYTFMVPMALASYNDINPSDTDARSALDACLNKWADMQGSISNTTGVPLYGVAGVWGGAWNVNSTVDQGWSPGYYAEGGWATWGYYVFYGWQSTIIQTMIGELMAIPEYPESIIHLGAIVGVMMTLAVIVPVIATIAQIANEKRKIRQEDIINMAIFIVVGVTLLGLVYALLP